MYLPKLSMTDPRITIPSYSRPKCKCGNFLSKKNEKRAGKCQMCMWVEEEEFRYKHPQPPEPPNLCLLQWQHAEPGNRYVCACCQQAQPNKRISRDDKYCVRCEAHIKELIMVLS